MPPARGRESNTGKVGDYYAMAKQNGPELLKKAFNPYDFKAQLILLVVGALVLIGCTTGDNIVYPGAPIVSLKKTSVDCHRTVVPLLMRWSLLQRQTFWFLGHLGICVELRNRHKVYKMLR